ncbi:MAG: magnesium chelatase ATPase subunit D [Anaerolineae bacterium]|nr:magnesium chelatase ATPase subunit D [Thermoflexales bacterium]MDW8406500.1 magnesium chelatase ATPase subunit D [Anaerolineae bacterium]
MNRLSFDDVVGMERAKQALLLLAVDPSLAGLALAAPVGSGKSTLARAFASLLPAGAPFVELPINVTEDRLIGGLDLEATLARGERVIEPGLLARAHSGVVYVDSLNLLDAGAAAHVMDALARGVVRVERDGVSAVYPTHFMLIGTFDPSDGPVAGSLLDRLGLIVALSAQSDVHRRQEVVRRNVRPASDRPDENGDDMLRALIELARKQLPHVAILDEQIEALARAALSLGVEGNRVDVFAVKAALASAALAGRADVTEADLEIAAKLVLLPRATRPPQPTAAEQPSQPSQAAPPPDGARDPAETPEEKSPDQTPTPEHIEELLLSAIETELPAELTQLPFAVQRRGKTGSRGIALNDRRGRYVRAVPGAPRGRKIALLPTLLAAAPWQTLRRAQQPANGHSASRVVLRKEDVRVKRFRDKAGTLFIFVVDASGSMALNRMREAKGTVARLLRSAYVHRDQVALIAFRGPAAQLLLPPSSSPDRARRELDVLPTGGGTPLASALWLAWQTARQARTRGIHNITLVLLTDGRANVSLHPHPDERSADKEQIQNEIHQLARCIAADRLNAVVIDTQAGYLSRGEARALAGDLNARYVYLPNARAHQITEVIAP